MEIIVMKPGFGKCPAVSFWFRFKANHPVVLLSLEAGWINLKKFFSLLSAYA
jgi:hypothetical protein